MLPRRTSSAVRRARLIFALALGLLSCRALFPEPTTQAPTARTTTSPTALPAGTQPTPADLESGSIGDPFTPELGNLGYDVQRYTLQLALDPAQPYFVEAVVSIEALSDLEALERISLDFVGFVIEEITVDGAEAQFERLGDKLVVDLPRSYEQAEPFTLAVSYEGTALQEPSRYLPFFEQTGLFYPDDESLYVLAEPDGARYWFPCNDHPRDKATFRFELRAPAGLTAVANGRLLETRPLEGGETLFVWQHDFPMGTYLATVAVAEYERIEDSSPGGVPLRHYTFPEARAEFTGEVAITGEALDWMIDLFGPYPFEAFGYLMVNGGGASLENQTMVVLDVNMLGEQVLVHEMAHMWFGDWVSLDSWGQMWRNEGFATYLEILWSHRDDPEALEAQMAQLTEEVTGMSGLEPLDDLSPGNLFGYESYVKGAVVVHALRQEMGDEAFFEGLRAYLERYGGGTASDADFQAVMEQAAGFSLDSFFDRWLRR